MYLMENTKKVLLNLGDAERNISWIIDQNNPIHIRFNFELDHDIDYDILKRAWDRTKKVYPLIDCVPKVVDGELLFVESDGENLPIESRIPVNPGTEVTAGRVLGLYYYKNKITANFFHTVTDGGGFTEVTRTLLYFYLSEYYGETDNLAGVEVKENRDIDEYYGIVTGDMLKDYTPVPLHRFPYGEKFFMDEDMVPDDGKILIGTLEVSADEFIAASKKIGANPSAFLCYLTAKASYLLNPDENRSLAFAMGINVRKIFGMEKSIGNHVSVAKVCISKDDVKSCEPEKVIERIRSDVDYQRTPDYVKYYADFGSSFFIKDLFKAHTVTYLGGFDVGVNTAHIKSVNVVTNATANVFMFQLNDKFRLMLELGKATSKYLDAMLKVMNEMGIDDITKAEFEEVLKDCDSPCK